MFFKKNDKKIVFSKKPKNVESLKSKKKSTKNVRNWMFFFQFLGKSFLFQYLSFSGVTKCDVILNIVLLERVVLWSPDWRNTDKRNWYWVYSMLQPTFLQDYKAHFFQVGLNQHRSTHKEVLL